jgi:hypothetical protein
LRTPPSLPFFFFGRHGEGEMVERLSVWSLGGPIVVQCRKGRWGEVVGGGSGWCGGTSYCMCICMYVKT